ncbi:hypothetical protein D3C87_1926300 [compost metagenome]
MLLATSSETFTSLFAGLSISFSASLVWTSVDSQKSMNCSARSWFFDPLVSTSTFMPPVWPSFGVAQATGTLSLVKPAQEKRPIGAAQISSCCMSCTSWEDFS